jgi:hypothetical protein
MYMFAPESRKWRRKSCQLLMNNAESWGGGRVHQAKDAAKVSAQSMFLDE